MTNAPHLRPTTFDEIVEALSFAMRYKGRRQVHDAADIMIQITADGLVQHLERSGDLC